MSFTSSEGTGIWEFVYDTKAGIPAVVEEVTPSGSVYYIREPSGGLIARVAGESIRYYHFDALGSTVMLTDGNGAVTDKYSYDAWGNTTHLYGAVEQPYQYVGEWGYYTHYQDENIGLLQLGLRFYDPDTATFTQRDPAEDGLNSYAYVAGRPTTAIDPSGLWIETGIDIIGTAWDIGDFIDKPTWGGAAWIAADVIGLLLPEVPSAGAVRRLGKLGRGASSLWGMAGQILRSNSGFARIGQRLGRYSHDILKTRADDLLTGGLKRSKSYHRELGQDTVEELIRKESGKGDEAKRARQMMKLIKDRQRLLDKTGGKNVGPCRDR